MKKKVAAATVSIFFWHSFIIILYSSFVFSSSSSATTTAMNNDDYDVSKATTTTTTTTTTTNLFRIVRYESGQTERNLPIFEATPHAASQLLDDKDEKEEEEKEDEQSCSSSILNEERSCSNNNDDDDVNNNNEQQKQKQIKDIQIQEYRDGVFVIHNVLSSKECTNIINMSEHMGYTLDAPVSLGRNIRHNQNCVWIMDPTINSIIFDRVQNVLPQSILLYQQNNYDLGKPIGLNRRWRLYKYTTNDQFKLHTDGSWTGSGIDNKTGKYKRDIYNGTALSWLTFLIYLNDNNDFDGGNTKFPISTSDDDNDDDDDRLLFLQRDNNNNIDEEQQQSNYFDVQPKQGSVLCFYHGYHPLSRLHEGSIVTNGTKYVARTEVLYKLPPEF